MLLLVNMVEEVPVHHIGVNTFKRDDEVRREPALGLDRDNRRKGPLNVFKYREGNHPLKGVELISDKYPIFYELEAVEWRLLRRVERDRDRRDNHQHREEIIAEEDRRDRGGHREDAKRPKPIPKIGVVGVFSPLPLCKRIASHL